MGLAFYVLKETVHRGKFPACKVSKWKISEDWEFLEWPETKKIP